MRLNKIAKDFNVGVQTLIEFIEKRTKAPFDGGPMTSVPDEIYEMLSREFNKDKSVKEQSERQRQQMQEARDKIKEETKAIQQASSTKAVTPGDEKLKQQLKVVGTIDLGKNGTSTVKQVPLEAVGSDPQPAAPRKETPKAPEAAAPAEAPKAAAPATPEAAAPVEASKAAAPAEAPETTAPAEAHKAATTHAEATAPAEAPEAVAPATPEAADGEPKTEEPKKPNQSAFRERSKDRISNDPLPEEARNGEIFRLNTADSAPTLKVTGTIDLDALNLSTRPKKKSKEERKKERDARSGRRRITAQKVDIDAAIKQGKGRNTKEEDEKKKNQSSGGKGGRNDRERDRERERNAERGADRGGKKRKDKGGKRLGAPEVNEEDVQKQVKEVLARLTAKPDKTAAKHRKDKRQAAAERAAAEHENEEAASKVLKLTEFVTANDLASMMNIPVTKVIMTCMSVGLMVSINQRLDAETINLVAEEYGFTTEYVSEEVEDQLAEEADAEDQLVTRPPIITVMGHVDHGKTKLLDYIRKTNVIAGEAGGITQHIGAYNVKLADGRHVTFLDTPGHEAFTAMRARGAKMTDIAIIIIAADDGIMPQTKEAINHAAAAGVPIVFAINKIDKPTANPNKVKEQLAAMNYLVEEWGGKYQSQDISAREGLNVDQLLEKVLLEAEMLDLKANPDKRASGSVIESTLDKGRGYVATVLVQNGTLRVGDVMLAGMHYGRVKAMYNERGQKVQEAGPSTPVQVLGLDGAPTAGDQFSVRETEQEAREIAVKRDRLRREQLQRTQKLLTLDDIGERIKVGNFQELNLIVKGDVDGSVEALSDSLIKLSTPEIKVGVIHKAVGQISESDVTLAAASKAIIIGFQVRPSQAAKRLADQDGVEIRLYSIIYDAIEEVKEAMEGMLVPETREEIDGYADVKSVFNITKVGTIAGCLVKEGKIKRTDKVRVIRDGIVLFTGELESLKRFKDDVKEVATNFECGLNIKGFNDVQEGDLIEAFSEIQVSRKL